MGSDIHGWIERSIDGSEWEPFMDVSHLNRNYDTFGLLFGVRNYGGFKPIAPKRGIPENASDFVKKEAEDEDSHSHTFITLEEYNKIDWNAESQHFDERVHVYEKKNNRWEYSYKAGACGDITTATLRAINRTEMIKDGKKYMLEKIKAKDILDGEFEDLFEYLNKVQKDHDWYKYRVVVWFDN